MKFLRPGKVVIVTSGRYAGKKAVIVQNTDSKSKERSYGHSLLAGIKKYPRKVVRGMSKRVILRRSQVGVFLRVVNHKHFLPTRYNMDLSRDLRGLINVSDASHKAKSKKLVKKLFQARYNAGSNRWFFQRLRF
ncbi:putative KOW motifRibosomal L27e protein family [Trypanosoma vivax]|uniref:Putative ribosomal protein L27 n=1 Tax=Trypanosoma vivax (strain Y486) TaxID=1055687 RepID=G0U9A0_TRYVY|nr:putative KOW motifRibosomal L27e protein family [Trypanosoma vivax]KAH8605080.1 putative KOW motifRibosomal L27e protein family [Trypanosoma vivax]CCC54185.1 putative ribosomal protein L27 [Trypanosoma vivax Y486]CCC54187.1 putative ribosomal protein L27 [Trypanosoma vivax Y486]